MPYCFVPGCNTGYPCTVKQNKLLGKKNCSLFTAPKDELLLEKWRRAVPRADKLLTAEHRVCELHFTEEDVDRYYTHVLPDGNIYKLERGRPILKKNSVPSIFPNLPAYLSSNTKKRKSPKARSVVTQKKQKVAAVSMSTEPSDEVPECSSINEDKQSFDNFVQNINVIVKPDSFWSAHATAEFIVFAKWNNEYAAEKRVILTKDLNVKVFLRNKEILLNCLVPSDVENMSALLNKVDQLVHCHRIDRNMPDCLGYVNESIQLAGRPRIVCENCFKEKPILCNTLKAKRKQFQQHRFKKSAFNVYRRNLRMKEKIKILKNKIQSIQKRCALANTKIVEEAISNFTPAQQEAIKACIAASKLKDKRGMRYTTQWIYHCLLLRIKSKKAYNHLRNHQILALPSIATLCRYIRKVKGVYGFQSHVFQCLTQKSASMDPSDRRGNLLVDEMKVSSAVTFNPKTMEVEGFTDLGKYTPHHQKCKKGDHALVMMFQPFKGKWVQAVACFLSRGAASGTVLHHLIVECIILLEKSGLNVDAVTTDGATWNRNMWSQFGISEENVSCEHVFDSSRRLWFLSDFPHLIKNLRTAVTTKKQLETPDGIVDLKCWKAVLELDNPKGFNLKVCPKLTDSHINPKHYQKMNVAMAFQFFGNSVASAMEIYKDDHPDLLHSDPSIKFIQKINELIDTMNCRTNLNGLKPNSNGEKVIKDFLDYLSEWEQLSRNTGSHFMSNSTCFGLKITLKGSLELVKFLTSDCSFNYLMTGRLNQDSLERFFGLMRDACGSNDHPDANVFIQLYRLMSTYSLIKPPRGSNITGGEILETLLAADVTETEQQREKWEEKFDTILDNGSSVEVIPQILENCKEHSYNMFSTPDDVISYVGGYIARRRSRFLKCSNCLDSLVEKENTNKNRHRLTNIKSRGYLIHDTDRLFTFLSVLEKSVLEVLSSESLSWDTFLSILSELETGPPIPLIGCQEHENSLTQHIMRFYLVTRMHFVCKQENRIDAAKVQKTKEFRKLSKL